MGYINIDIDDLLNNCSSSDIKEIIQNLVETGWLKESALGPEFSSIRGVYEHQYEEALDKLHGRWNMLTEEEENQILKIANRLP